MQQLNKFQVCSIPLCSFPPTSLRFFVATELQLLTTEVIAAPDPASKKHLGKTTSLTLQSMRLLTFTQFLRMTAASLEPVAMTMPGQSSILMFLLRETSCIDLRRDN